MAAGVDDLFSDDAKTAKPRRDRCGGEDLVRHSAANDLREHFASGHFMDVLARVLNFFARALPPSGYAGWDEAAHVHDVRNPVTQFMQRPSLETIPGWAREP